MPKNIWRSSNTIRIFFFLISISLLAYPVFAAYLHRAYDYCSNHGGVNQQISYDISTWGQCRDWCDPIMNADHTKLCQYNADGVRNCWINNAPVGGINTCTWQSNSGNPPYGAWWFGNETPTPSPTPIAGQSHREGLDYCQTSTTKVRAYTSSRASFDLCLAWCDTVMTAEYPICQWDYYTNTCDVYFPAPAGLSACNWVSDYRYKGAWLAAFDPPTYRVANLDTSLDANKLMYNSGNFTQSIGSRIEVGDASGSGIVDQDVALIQSDSNTVIAKLNADFATGGIDLDWSNLDSISDKFNTKVLLNNSGGDVSQLPGMNEAGTLIMRQNGVLSPEWLTDVDDGLESYFWGNAVSVDENNNFVLGEEFEDEVYVTIWNDPSSITLDNYDHKIVLSSIREYNWDVTVISIGNSNFLAIWDSRDISYTDYSIRGRVFKADGTYVTDEFQLALDTNRKYEPKAVLMDSGNIMTGWYDYDPINGNDVVIAQEITQSGTLVGSQIVVSDPVNQDSDYIDMAVLTNGNIVFVYIDWYDEYIYYRVYDPDTDTFLHTPQVINMYDPDNYGGDWPQVAANDGGGFAVMFGGYYDGVDYYDRMFLQLYDSSFNALYDTAEEIMVSDDDVYQWWWDTLDLAYSDGYYHLVWDTFGPGLDSNDHIGIAYRKVAIDGTKGNLFPVDHVLEQKDPWGPAITIDRNGVPFVAWNKAPINGTYNDDIFSFWAPVPNEVPERVGICPDATALNEINDDCGNLSYKVLGDPEVTDTSDLVIPFGLKLSGVEGGGAFIDYPPAIVIKDFPEDQIVSSTLDVSWYDLGEAAGGDILFYVDSNDNGFDGTALPGMLTGASATNNASLDVSGLTNGTYYIYAVIDDGYYDPYMDYAPYSFEKYAEVTPTPSVSPTPTTVPGDTEAPGKVRITNIGLISNVADADNLAYYFTSQSPVIKGNSEAGSTVYFSYNGTNYTTTAGGDGKFTLTISNLPRTTVNLTYYAKDAAGNKSPDRYLQLIIGIENFPQWLVDKLNGTSTNDEEEVAQLTVTPTMTPFVSITLTPTVSKVTTITPTNTAKEVVITVKDNEGNLLINTEVEFDGQKMRTNAQGQLILSNITPGEHELKVNGEVQGINISEGSNSLVAYVGTEATESGPSPAFYITLILGGLVILGLGIAFLKKL